MTPPTPTPVPRFVRGLLPALHLSTSTAVPEVDTLVVPVLSGPTGPEIPAVGPVDEAERVALWKSAVAAGVTGKAGETVPLPAPDGTGVRSVVAAGLGPVDRLTPETVRRTAGAASRMLGVLAREAGARTGRAASLLGCLGTGDGLTPEQATAAAAEGHALGGYVYPGRRSTPPADLPCTVTVIAPDLPGIPAAFTRACTVVEAVACARDLVDAPAGDLWPDAYAEIIAGLAAESGVEVTVLDEAGLAEQGFGGLVTVGRGSTRPPRLVRMHYRPEGPESPESPADRGTPVPHVALVGKGVTFDTGGVSLKRPAGMDHMISDMAGSAAVVATVLAAAELELPVAVTATLPLAENMPDGDAVRPGDVLRHYDGTTSEVLNTDAEGRLILADAIARAAEDGPDLLVETATLTGAQVAALGDRITAVMGTPALRDRIVALSAVTGEDAWPMPLPAEIAGEIRSDVADLRNTGTSPWGGMAAAGHYLGHFVPDGLPWAHLDIAGPAYNTGTARGYTPARGTGVPVRTLVALLESLSAPE